MNVIGTLPEWYLRYYFDGLEHMTRGKKYILIRIEYLISCIQFQKAENRTSLREQYREYQFKEK